jgi:hypothetical protein
MRASGFIEIEVRHFKLHVGEWGDDERSRNIGRRGAVIKTGTVSPLMEGMKYVIPDDNERSAFVTRVEGEIKDPSYHLYIPLYVLVWIG